MSLLLRLLLNFGRGTIGFLGLSLGFKSVVQPNLGCRQPRIIPPLFGRLLPS